MKGLLAVLLIATLFLPGCATEIVIPPSLSPTDVVEEIFPDQYSDFTLESLSTGTLPRGAGKEGFVNGYDAWSLNYTKADGTTLRAAGGPEVLPLLIFYVLKYENTEFAQRSYDGISEALEFQNFSYRNITLKAYVEPPSEVLSVSNSWGYNINSGCFVILIITFGAPDVAQDALDRTIATFGI